MKPISTGPRISGLRTDRSIVSAASRPSTNDPLTFTASVPHGKPPRVASETQPSTRYRAIAPANPPSPMRTRCTARTIAHH